MKNVIIFTLILGIKFSSLCQYFPEKIVSIGNGYRSVYNNDVAIDSDGNSIIVGNFTGIIDFDPGPNVHNLSAANGTEYQAFIQKLDNNVHIGFNHVL